MRGAAQETDDAIKSTHAWPVCTAAGRPVGSYGLRAQKPMDFLTLREGAPPSGNFALRVAPSVAESSYSTSPVPSAGLTVALRVRLGVETGK